MNNLDPATFYSYQYQIRAFTMSIIITKLKFRASGAIIDLVMKLGMNYPRYIFSKYYDVFCSKENVMSLKKNFNLKDLLYVIHTFYVPT